MTQGASLAPAFAEPLPIVSAPAVLAFLARRRSASAMALRAPGPTPEELSDLLTIAARVPDHGKLAPWRFVILEGAGKDNFADRLQSLAAARSDAARLIAKLGKLRTPPLGVAVISRTTAGEIPEWEQLLSAGAVCTTLTYAALAMGYGANWITDWHAYDAGARAVLGLAEDERVAGFVFLGKAAEAPLERVRPDVAALTTRFEG